MINCCLWIGGKKVSDLDGIKKNFDIADVRGYFLAGTLADWLIAHNATKEAELLMSISKDADDIDKELKRIFTEEITAQVKTATQTKSFHFKSDNLPRPLVFGCSFPSSFNGSFYEYEYEYQLGSFSPLSFNTSYLLTSYLLTSFNLSLLLGSFNLSSFVSGSFDLSSFLYGSFSYDDFTAGGKFTPLAMTLYLSSEPLNRYGYGINLI